jgi:hypothetical protein
MKATLLILLIAFSLNALAQTKQELPSGFFYNTSPLTIDQKTGETDYVFSGMLLVFDIANAADLVLTKRALKSEEVYEGNPIMREVLRREPLDWILKLGMTATLNYILKMGYNEDKTSAYVAAIILSGSYSWLAYRNYRIVIQLGM